jgi:acetyl esterase/lipase
VFTPPGVDARQGDLCGPAHPRDRVAILVIHGGGGSQGNRQSSVAWVDRFNAAGYLTFAIDYFTFTDATRPPVYPREEQEVKAAVQYLRAHAVEVGINAERIVAQGISAGAQLAGALLVTPDDPAFAWPGRWPGVSDRVAGLIGLYGYYDGYQLNPEKMYGGPRTSTRPAVVARYARADLDKRAAAATGPALLFAGGADTLIPPDQTTRFADALRAAGKDVEATIVPGVGHGFDHPGGPDGLSPEGEKVAVVVFAWLARQFGVR